MNQTTLLHRNQPPLNRIPSFGRRFMDTLILLIHSRSSILRRLARSIVLNISRRGKVILSNENLSMQPYGIWTNDGIGPDLFLIWLAKLKEQSKGHIKIVFRIRDWSDWLASRYAQSAKHFSNAGQADFESRIQGILASDVSSASVLGWLDFEEVIASLKRVLGSANVFFYRFEDLEDNPTEVVARLIEFCEVDVTDSLLDISQAKRWNVRRTSASSWQLRESTSEIFLTKELREDINRHFGQYGKLVL
jgi:hypothetical protein